MIPIYTLCVPPRDTVLFACLPIFHRSNIPSVLLGLIVLHMTKKFLHQIVISCLFAMGPITHTNQTKATPKHNPKIHYLYGSIGFGPYVCVYICEMCAICRLILNSVSVTHSSLPVIIIIIEFRGGKQQCVIRIDVYEYGFSLFDNNSNKKRLCYVIVAEAQKEMRPKKKGESETERHTHTHKPNEREKDGKRKRERQSDWTQRGKRGSKMKAYEYNYWQRQHGMP